MPFHLKKWLPLLLTKSNIPDQKADDGDGNDDGDDDDHRKGNAASSRSEVPPPIASFNKSRGSPYLHNIHCLRDLG